MRVNPLDIILSKIREKNLKSPTKAVLLLLIITVSLTAVLFVVTTSISDIPLQTSTNGTFGERPVSINNITIVDNVTAEHYEYNGTNYYYVTGYLKNNNKFDAYNLKMKAIVFDSEGNVVAEDDTVYLNPKVLLVDSETFFGFYFTDNDKRIVRYELKLISVDAEA